MAQTSAGVYELGDTQRDTAGLVILHQQYVLRSAVDDMSSSVAVSPYDSPVVLLHIPMPLIGVLTPFVVHVDVQPATLSPGFLYVHVVLLFNATHLVTAWAGWIIMLVNIPARISCVFIFRSPCFGSSCVSRRRNALDDK